MAHDRGDHRADVSVAADFKARASAVTRSPGTVDPSLDSGSRCRVPSPVGPRRGAGLSSASRWGGSAPEEVAALAVYLASDEAAFTTGAIHIIDGGFTL
jgi:2-keto-3-deoxy-L-fuconate dehydrogenase